MNSNETKQKNLKKTTTNHAEEVTFAATITKRLLSASARPSKSLFRTKSLRPKQLDKNTSTIRMKSVTSASSVSKS